MAKLVLKQSVKAHGPLVYYKLFLWKNLEICLIDAARLHYFLVFIMTDTKYSRQFTAGTKFAKKKKKENRAVIQGCTYTYKEMSFVTVVYSHSQN